MSHKKTPRLRGFPIQEIFLKLFEEVVALVVNKDKRREVFNFNLPNSFHSKLRIFHKLDFLDVVLRENRRGAAD